MNTFQAAEDLSLHHLLDREVNILGITYSRNLLYWYPIRSSILDDASNLSFKLLLRLNFISAEKNIRIRLINFFREVVYSGADKLFCL